MGAGGRLCRDRLTASNRAPSGLGTALVGRRRVIEGAPEDQFGGPVRGVPSAGQRRMTAGRCRRPWHDQSARQASSGTLTCRTSCPCGAAPGGPGRAVPDSPAGSGADTSFPVARAERRQVPWESAADSGTARPTAPGRVAPSFRSGAVKAHCAVGLGGLTTTPHVGRAVLAGGRSSYWTGATGPPDQTGFGRSGYLYGVMGPASTTGWWTTTRYQRRGPMAPPHAAELSGPGSGPSAGVTRRLAGRRLQLGDQWKGCSRFGAGACSSPTRHIPGDRGRAARCGPGNPVPDHQTGRC
jgi:hypothetical protein